MEEARRELPDECWAMIFNKVDPEGDWEFVSLVCKKFLSITNFIRVRLHVFNPSTQVLSRMLQRFPHLKKIELVGFPGDLNEAILSIAHSGLDLQELNLMGNQSLPKVSLEELGSNMKNLKVLDCSYSSLTDVDLVRIATFFPGLEKLLISNSYEPEEVDGRIIAVTDEGVHLISKKLKRLRKIDLSWNDCISDKSLLFLSSNCAFLEEIVAIHYGGVTEKGISFILQNNHHLNSLNGSTHFKFESFGARGSASFSKNLQSLSFGRLTISDDFLYSITEAKIPLKEFTLSFCKGGYTFTGISSLVCSYQSLTNLVLMGAEFLTDEQIEQMSKFLPKLTSIKLHTCPKLSDSAFVSLSQRCPLLRHLEMGGTSIGKEEYIYDGLVERNFAIISLSLPLNSYLSSSSLMRLLYICPNIEKLILNNCFQREEELDIVDILGCSREIKCLMLNACQNLKFSRKLAEVSKLKRLFATYLGVGDEVLGMIGKNCPSLSHLYLNDCDKLTEEGIMEAVMSCERLRSLYLSACSNVNSDITSLIVSNRPSLRCMTIPAHLYPEEEQQKCFLQGGCLVNRGVDYDELI